MNLLVIGNGFDLALGLPTQYKDFLNFIKAFDFVYSRKSLSELADSDIRSIFLDAKVERMFLMEEDKTLEHKTFAKKIFLGFTECQKNPCFTQAIKDMHYCIHDNRWSKYFQNAVDEKSVLLGNWCGIEQEIKKIIQGIEQNDYCDEKAKDEIKYTNNWAKVKIEQLCSENAIKYSANDYFSIKQLLRKEFNLFTVALGIYIDFFASHAKKKLPFPKDVAALMQGSEQKIDHVLNFNYIDNITSTVETGTSVDDFMCFVHGKACYMEALNAGKKIDDIIKDNTMVLGFDEYLDSEKKNDMLDFVYYRKYFQRIFKATDNSYVKWLHEPTPSEDNPHKVYIFGHSLDETDKEIFKYIFADGIKTTIFYHSDEAKDRIITNLIHILGQDVLVDKINGISPDIKLVRQSE